MKSNLGRLERTNPRASQVTALLGAAGVGVGGTVSWLLQVVMGSNASRCRTEAPLPRRLRAAGCRPWPVSRFAFAEAAAGRRPPRSLVKDGSGGSVGPFSCRPSEVWLLLGKVLWGQASCDYIEPVRIIQDNRDPCFQGLGYRQTLSGCGPLAYPVRTASGESEASANDGLNE